MGTVGRLKKGDLLIAGETNERLPVVTNGLVNHFPFDGSGGAWDIVGGNQASGGIENGVNLVETMSGNWRQPSSWSSNANMEWSEKYQALKIVGYRNSWLNTPIVIDTTKTYELMYEVMIEDKPSGSILYLGGLSNNAEGIRATANYDYTIAAGASLSVGVWTTFKLTRTGTAVAGSGNSYSYDTVKGWNGGGAIANPIIKYYHMGGLFNYSVGGTMYVRNMSMRVVANETSNTTITPQGISVEEATTNILSASIQDFTAFSGYSGAVITKEYGLSVGEWDTHKAVRLTSTGGTSYLKSYLGVQTSILNQAYTSQVLIKNVGNSPVRFYTQIGPRIYVDPGESKLVKTSGVGNGTSQYQLRFETNAAADDLDIIVANIQTEHKAFGTSYTNGSRGTGRVDIPFELKPPYSVNLFHKPSVTLDTVVDQGTSPMILQFNGYYSNASISLWNFAKNLNVFIKGNASGGWTSTTTHSVFNSITWDNQEHMYTIVAVNNRTFKTYLDGVYLGQQTSSEDVTNITYLSMGNTSMPNAQYRDMSLYNRALTDEEVKKLGNSSFSIGKEGSIKSEVREKSNGVAVDVKYFPLGVHSMDENQTYKPAVELESAYKDGAVWVGTATTNVAAGTLSPYAPYNTVTRIGQDLTFTMIGTTITIHNGTDYNGQIIAISGYLKKNGLPHAFPGTRANTYHTVPAIKWYFDKSTGYFEIIENCNAASVWLLHTQSGAVAGDIITIDSFQVEQKTFVSPLTNGTRGVSRLEYNLNTSMGLDWNLNWSIVYWKKPISTYTNALTGYALESLGSNANSVGGGYLYWGKNNGADNIFGASPGTFTPAQYFDNWQMVSLVKSGTTITIKIWGVGGVVHTRAVGIGTVPSNYYVNQHGYDFKLGGWDAANPINAYYKDLVIAKRAFSDAEVLDIFQTQIRANKENRVTIQGQVKEGEVL